MNTNGIYRFNCATQHSDLYITDNKVLTKLESLFCVELKVLYA